MEEVKIKAVMPTNGGCAVFIGGDEKVFIIYVDHAVGASISSFMQDIPSDRPLTHDLVCNIINSLDAEIKHVVINDYDNGIFFARLVFESKNRFNQTNIIEIDTRPSDAIAVALRSATPIHVTEKVLDIVEDMTELYTKLCNKNMPF